MDNNRAAIARELIVILVVVALLLAAGGLLVRNVVVALRSLDEGQIARELDSGQLEKTLGGIDLEKTLRDLAGKILPAREPQPAPPPAAAPAAGSQPAAGAKHQITAVRFFEGGQTPPALSQRSYASQFSPQARIIYTEIAYKNKNHKIADAAIPVVIRYLAPDGRQIAEQQKTARPKKNWASAIFTTGAANSGPWQPGRHTVKIYFDGDHIGDYTFTIQ
jgi:hypothetical protein